MCLGESQVLRFVKVFTDSVAHGRGQVFTGHETCGEGGKTAPHACMMSWLCAEAGAWGEVEWSASQGPGASESTWARGYGRLCHKGPGGKSVSMAVQSRPDLTVDVIHLLVKGARLRVESRDDAAVGPDDLGPE